MAGSPPGDDTEVPGVGDAGVRRPLRGEPAEDQAGNRIGICRRGYERGAWGKAAVHGRTLSRKILDNRRYLGWLTIDFSPGKTSGPASNYPRSAPRGDRRGGAGDGGS